MARKGFTLLEVLMVVVVLSILASMSFGLLRVVENSKIAAVEGRVHTLGIQASTVAGLTGFPPATLEDLAPKLEKPEWIKDGKFVDAWEHPLMYRVDGKKFRLWSCGPDGISGTDDDLPYRRN
ncbi:MAG TPA: prepilin-type N-terminal cleavage/methylation domain-containing protein [Planctomycetota bacterium]|nr:prepilin-type N-terminal cleavage/methylation domain-containing protein [Planctomycetota bacterium]